MARSRRRLMLAGGACALALVAGGTTAAAWASSSPTASKAAEVSVTGTVAAPSEASENGQELSPQAESTALAPLAKVTQQKAEAAATAAVPGSVTSTTLEEEDGFVVWHVNVTNGSATTEVSVDAGSGAILHQEAAGTEQGQGKEQEASDGDSETADDNASGAQVSDGDGEQADAAEVTSAG